MNPTSAKVVIKALEKKGFRRSNSKDLRFVFYDSDDKKTMVSTMVSHGEREIDIGLLRCMAKQMRLTMQQFESFVECSLDKATYEAVVKAVPIP